MVKYFNDIIIEAGKRRSEDDDEELRSLHDAHELILILSERIPNILFSIIPQLEEELKV